MSNLRRWGFIIGAYLVGAVVIAATMYLSGQIVTAFYDKPEYQNALSHCKEVTERGGFCTVDSPSILGLVPVLLVAGTLGILAFITVHFWRGKYTGTSLPQFDDKADAIS